MSRFGLGVAVLLSVAVPVLAQDTAFLPPEQMTCRQMISQFGGMARLMAQGQTQAQARKDQLSGAIKARGCNAATMDAPAPETAPAAAATPQQSVGQPAAASPQPAMAAPPTAPQVPPQEIVAAAAQAIVPMPGTIKFDRKQAKVASNPRVFVPNFRVAFVVHTEAQAYAGAGAADIGSSYGRTVTQAQNKKVELNLTGVDLALMQALTDRLYEDFMTRLSQSGREIIPYETVMATQGAEKLKPTKTPYSASPGSMHADPRDYVVLSPSHMPLFFHYVDVYLGNVSPFDQASARGLFEIAARLDAVAVTPTILIDIAEVQSSGRSNWSAGASADVVPRLGIGWRSEIRFINGHNAKVFYDGELGFVWAKNALFGTGEYGTMVSVESYNTAGLANSLTQATGTQGVQFYQVGSSRVDLQACKLEYSIVSPK